MIERLKSWLVGGRDNFEQKDVEIKIYELFWLNKNIP